MSEILEKNKWIRFDNAVPRGPVEPPLIPLAHFSDEPDINKGIEKNI
jgi:hypothetical protein